MTRAMQLWTLLSLCACTGSAATVLVGAWRGDQGAGAVIVTLTALSSLVPFVIQARRDEREHARLAADLQRATATVVSLDRALLAERVAAQLQSRAGHRAGTFPRRSA